MKQFPFAYIVMIGFALAFIVAVSTTAISPKSGDYSASRIEERQYPNVINKRNGVTVEEIYYYNPYDENNNFINLDTSYVDERGIRIVRTATPGSYKNPGTSTEPNSAQTRTN